MLERHVASGQHFGDIAPSFSNIVYIDPRPHNDRPQQARRIGAFVSSWWLTESGRGAISHVPTSLSYDQDGNLRARFLQYQKGSIENEFSIPHLEGWSGGPETLSILDVRLNSASGAIEAHAPLARNLRYVLADQTSRSHDAKNRSESEALHRELWGEPSQAFAAD